MDIKLNFINRSNDLNNSQVVVFQKNTSTDFDNELHTAWKVIRNCGLGDNHPFVFPMAMEIGASDSWGNYTPKLLAENGQLFHVSQTGSGDTLSLVGSGTSTKEVHVRNDLETGAVNASIYKDGRVLAIKTAIAPAQKAVFEFKPTLWIGAVSQVVEGQVMNSAVMSDVNTEIPLLGIASADIVMTGGGPGTTSTALKFSLENVVMA